MNLNIFGANWQTTVSGIGAAFFSLLTILSAIPYETGGIAEIFPVEWKPKILVASIASAFILKIWNAAKQKDKTVTGGSTQQTLGGSTVEPGKQSLVDATKAASPADEKCLAPEVTKASTKKEK